MHTYLALGDSYTIGEGVPLHQGYPYQTVQLLRTSGRPFHAPEIVARTGWTTDELAHTLATLRLLPHYDFVSLLIGVNDQYRGHSAGAFSVSFRKLLQTALRLADSPARVFVVSIPDWGYSPFATGRDRSLITGEIDQFNADAAEIARHEKVHFIDITTQGRTQGAGPEYFVADGLHPAPATYHFWAEQLGARILAGLPVRQFPVD
jgi:lysophospholipase L1-like esterase